jgi:hypothetical protein
MYDGTKRTRWNEDKARVYDYSDWNVGVLKTSAKAKERVYQQMG